MRWYLILSLVIAGCISSCKDGTKVLSASSVNNTPKIGLSSLIQAPTFSVASGTYSATQSVSLSTSTPSAKIYYTVDGSTPTTSSLAYSSSLSISSSTTVSAIAYVGGQYSSVSSATYSISSASTTTNASSSSSSTTSSTSTVATPTFSPSAGVYSTSQNVAISTTTTGATIYYTTDGSTPTTSSSTYSSPISISSTATIKAIATKTSYSTSSEADAIYYIVPAPTIAASNATLYTVGISLSTSVSGAKIYYTNDGSTPTTASTQYSAAFTIYNAKTIKAIVVDGNSNSSPVATGTYSPQAIKYTAQTVSSGTTGMFGRSMVELPNGYIVIASPYDSVNGISQSGAVYVFDSNGNLISTISGSTAYDYVGNGGVYAVGGATYSNFVIVSNSWHSVASSVGAITFCSTQSGCGSVSSTVSSTNSLVGSSNGDLSATTTIKVLSNGNYVVAAPNWTNVSGSLSNVGAVTLCGGTSGCSGPISSTISFVGSHSSDRLGSGAVVELTTGNLVFGSPNYNSNAGAVTTCSGSSLSSCNGLITLSNSLVGFYSNEYLGTKIIANRTSSGSGDDYFVALATGNSTVGGYALWCPATVSACVGYRSSSTNIVNGNFVGDFYIGASLTALNNGFYAIAVPGWKFNVGLVAICPNTGCSNQLLSATNVTNGLVGYNANDYVGSGGVIPLAGTKYIVVSPNWRSGSYANAGAVTYCDTSTSSCKGNSNGTLVSNSNSLTGASTSDYVGGSSSSPTYGGVSVVPNGSNVNYVVYSPNSGGGYGSVTFCLGSSGCFGSISSSNSLVGWSNTDQLGWGRVVALNSTGNYVVQSPYAAGTDGASTLCSGSTGNSNTCVGSFSNFSSYTLTGASSSEMLGSLLPANWPYSPSIVPLTNGNYYVFSQNWNSSNGGAIWCSGTSGCSGNISASTGLVGTSNSSSERFGQYGGLALQYGANAGKIIIPNPYEGFAILVSGTSATTGNVDQ